MKKLVFRFVGGDRDGATISTDDPETADDAKNVFWMTNGGQIGMRIWYSSQHGNEYSVSERHETADTLTLTLTAI